MKITKQSAGFIGDNEVLLYSLEADNGTVVKITNIGATITSICTADKNGKIGEIALGFDDPKQYLDEDYQNNCLFFGATVGRFANRIGGAKFTLDGKTYELEQNDGRNTLHGGVRSFHAKFWQSESFETAGRVGVKMSYISPNMENGYPGELTVNVAFTLNNSNELSISYKATTDKPTVVNLTNHSYFNLRGHGDILDTHVLMQANQTTERDETNIPTGEIVTVKGTPLDFTLEHKVGERVHMFDDGYDHNYVLAGVAGELREAAQAWDEESGRKLIFSTTEPAFQFYTGHYLNGLHQRGELKFNQYCGFCLEAQHYPDSPNKSNFPTTVLRPGETYAQTTIYKFTTI